MNEDVYIVDITPDNISKYPATCFISPEHKGYLEKLQWFRDHYKEDLSIKLIFKKGNKKHIGYIEYTPGKFAWRAVDARGYMFINCIWTSPNKQKNRGYASRLIREVVNEAKEKNMYGVAVVASDGPLMAGKELFLKNGFEVVQKSEPYYLMIKKIKDGRLPGFNDWEEELKDYKGLNIVYSSQCPWISRSIDEIKEISDERGLNLKIKKIESAEIAQKAPSIYASFSLIYDGKLIVDHYISKRRFTNILDKELKI